MKTQTSSQIEYSIARRRSGFTLIELLVVMAIAAVLSALLVGGFYQISASNRRSNCQVNLSQIYTALKMYSQDEPNNKFPDFESLPLGNNSMGLWKLYTVQGDPVPPASGPDTSLFPSALLNNGNRKITGMYLKSYKNLHCPADEFESDVDDDGDPNTDPILLSNAELFIPNTQVPNSRFNQNYLSYQGFDTGAPKFSNTTDPDVIAAYNLSLTPPGVSTYLPRRPITDVNDPDWKRQLMPHTSPSGGDVVEKQPAANTVVTWCRHHRTGLGARDSDIVLFYDGSIQTIAQQQHNPDGAPLMTWRRKAKAADF